MFNKHFLLLFSFIRVTHSRKNESFLHRKCCKMAACRSDLLIFYQGRSPNSLFPGLHFLSPQLSFHVLQDESYDNKLSTSSENLFDNKQVSGLKASMMDDLFLMSLRFSFLFPFVRPIRRKVEACSADSWRRPPKRLERGRSRRWPSVLRMCRDFSNLRTCTFFIKPRVLCFRKERLRKSCQPVMMTCRRATPPRWAAGRHRKQTINEPVVSNGGVRWPPKVFFRRKTSLATCSRSRRNQQRALQQTRYWDVSQFIEFGARWRRYCWIITSGLNPGRGRDRRKELIWELWGPVWHSRCPEGTAVFNETSFSIILCCCGCCGCHANVSWWHPFPLIRLYMRWYIFVLWCHLLYFALDLASK